MSLLRGLIAVLESWGKDNCSQQADRKGEEEAREKEYGDSCQFDQDACGVHIWASLRHSGPCEDPQWTIFADPH